MQILTARPDGMPFAKYRDHMRRQTKWIKSRLKGFLVYKAIEQYDFDVATQQHKMVRRHPPFVGNTRDIKPI